MFCVGPGKFWTHVASSNDLSYNFNHFNRSPGTLEASQTWRGTTLRGQFFLKKKGALFKNKKGTSLFIAKSWGGTCPQCPRFLRLCRSLSKS